MTPMSPVPPAPPDYQWDIFLSYRRDPPVESFVHKVLDPALRDWLPQHAALQRERVFLDVRECKPGVDWTERLEHALRHTRCLIPVLSPTYFDSSWCMTEFYSMLARQQATGKTLIYPLRFSDGDFFPADVKALGHCDIAKFSAARGPLRTPAFMQLIEQVCVAVGGLVRQAPSFDPGWSIERPKPVSVLFGKPGF
jgi:hypothetical protein